MQLFPAMIVADGSGFRVSFRDVPESLTWGGSREQAIEMAEDALLTSMDFYFEGARRVPSPSKPRIGETLIDMPANAVAKILLHNAMITSEVGPRELARRLGTTLQVVNRMVNLRLPTPMDAIDQALAALGKRLVLSAV